MRLHKALFTATIISLLLPLLNCTPTRITSSNFGKDTKTSNVKVYRENKFLFLGVPAIFGYNNKDKVKLWKGDRSEIKVPIGNHEFFVRSNQADRPSKLNVEIKEGETTCFIINPEPKPIAKMIIIPLYWFTHAFKIEKSDRMCQQTY